MRPGLAKAAKSVARQGPRSDQRKSPRPTGIAKRMRIAGQHREGPSLAVQRSFDSQCHRAARFIGSLWVKVFLGRVLGYPMKSALPEP
jgi:hypothetical protein